MKKKILALLLATITVISLVACGGKETPDIETEMPTEESMEVESTEATEATEATVESEATEATEATVESEAVDFELTLETSLLLDSVFDSYADDQKFPYGAMIGDMYVDGVPMEMDLSDTDTLQSYLVFPVELADKVSEVSSVVHMMNANLFTSVAMKVDTEVAMDDLKEIIAGKIEDNQWLCGAPEVLVTAHKDSTLIYAFGAQDIVDVFVEKLAITDEEMTIDELIPLAGYELAE